MSIALRIPKPVEPVIEDYVSVVSQQLPGWIDAFYIVGSIALDEFNEQFSDIDFIAILNRKATSREIEELRRVHHVIEKNHPRWKMSGSYIQPSDLGKLDDEVQPHPHYHDGVLHPNNSYELNSVTWWELKHRGITVLGEAPQNLPFTVDWDRLVSWMKENMNCYWVSWTNRPIRVLSLYSDWGVQWAVLGVLRQFYTFKGNSITTKVRAGRYALGCLPIRWHKLIQEAIGIREGKKRSAYRSRIARMIEAVNFLKYVIQLCNTSFPLK